MIFREKPLVLLRGKIINLKGAQRIFTKRHKEKINVVILSENP